MKRVYALLSFLALTSAKLETRDIFETKDFNVNVNHIVDSSNPQITQFIIKRRLDPLNLPYTEKKLWTPISDSVDPTLYKADLILSSGVLKHLSVLERYDDATVTYQSKIVRLEVGFAFKFLQASYKYVVKMGLFDLNGYITATTKDVRAKISAVFNTSDYTLFLDKLDIQTPGRIKVAVENRNGKIDWINTAIVNIAIPFFQDTITTNIQTEAANAIQTYFNEINRMISPSKMYPRIFGYHLLKRVWMNEHRIPMLIL